VDRIGAAQMQLAKEQTADIMSRNVCNTLKGLAPFFSAVLRCPSSTLDDQTALVLLQQATERVTQRVLRDVGFDAAVDPPKYIERSVYVTVARSIARIWREKSQLSPPDEDRVAKVLGQTVRSAQAIPAMDIGYEPDKRSTTVTLLHALTPLIDAFERNDLGQKRASVFRRASALISESALSEAIVLAGEGAASRTVGFVTQSLLTHAGDIYASAWLRHADILARSTALETEPVFGRASIPSPTENVDAMFRESFSILVDAAQVGIVLDAKIAERADADAVPTSNFVSQLRP